MIQTRRDGDFLNGVPELLLLRLLSRQPMHGYELVSSIKLESAGVLRFGEGSVYPVLHRLQSEGLLEANRELVAGRSRVVYRVSADGRKRLAEATAHWASVARAISGILDGDGHEPQLA